MNKLAKCEFNGKTYYEGQRIDTEKSCFTCTCAKGFEDKPVEENKHCHKIHCNMELHYASKITAGCIPIYFKTEDCCPIGWRCPDDETTIVADKTRTKDDTGKKTEDDTFYCTFGKLKMNLGDSLSADKFAKSCITCSCLVPPQPHCIQNCN